MPECVFGTRREPERVDQFDLYQLVEVRFDAERDQQIGLNRDPMTAPALNVAERLRRSMRAAMVACSVAGTPSAREIYVPDFPFSTPRSASSRTISSAKNGLPVTLSAIARPSAPTDRSGPSRSATNFAVAELLSGRAMV
jgi:hypothetical protein